MLFKGDPRRRSVALLAGGLLLILVLLGALQAFNTTLPVKIWHYSFNVDFLNPETAGETLLFTASRYRRASWPTAARPRALR